MEDNCVFPSTSSQEVPDYKIKQTAKPKSAMGKARKKKGDNTPEDPYARVKRSKSQKLKGLPLDKAEQLRLKLNEQIADRRNQIESHDQVHGVSEHLQQQTQLHQQRLQEKLDVMQQEEAQYQLEQQQLEQEILLHQQQTMQKQQLLQQPTTCAATQ
ncbi:mediator of RNA polymerase II transcription subunit 15 [Biomphalaria pfeifferi]|uniref:Mediator of RNA polymerase II transcription subunit 15 n=1 Tax=Biomphalaria pfeifferi TaxID=112525 RepID=A0AAD8BYU0_BIOPF|nr:mediator of RNA polymerase II transcription subunit 15 [Biomphalaria pfeifferi]